MVNFKTRNDTKRNFTFNVRVISLRTTFYCFHSSFLSEGNYRVGFFTFFVIDGTNNGKYLVDNLGSVGTFDSRLLLEILFYIFQ